ncbi:MAG: N-acetyltransferase family protein [Ramlibacter sp.]
MASIQRLQPGHAEAYRALMLDAYARHPDAFTSSVAEREALPLAWWQARLSTDAQAADWVLGAFTGDTLAGAAGLSFDTRDKARHKATLFGMYVPPVQRGAGIGRQLVLAALAQARQRPGVRQVLLTVTQGNTAAQRLYERCGFKAFGVEPRAVAVDGGFVNKVHMWCDLGLLASTD